MLKPLRRRHAVVVVRAREDELIGFQVLVENHLPGLGALLPHVVRHVALRGEEAADLRPNDVVDPVHALLAPRRQLRMRCLGVSAPTISRRFYGCVHALKQPSRPPTGSPPASAPPAPSGASAAL